MTLWCCCTTIKRRSNCYSARSGLICIAIWLFLSFGSLIAFISLIRDDFTDINCTSVNNVTISRRNLSDYTISCTDNNMSLNSSADCNSTTINVCKSNENDEDLMRTAASYLAKTTVAVVLSPFVIFCVLCPCICVRWATGSSKSICLLSAWLKRGCNKPLGKLLNELHISIVETVNHKSVEKYAKQYLDKFFEELSQHTNFCNGMDLMLSGSVAESFSLPFYPGYVLDYTHANISDFDFMLSSKTESASFEENNNVKYKVVYNEEFLDLLIFYTN